MVVKADYLAAKLAAVESAAQLPASPRPVASRSQSHPRGPHDRPERERERVHLRLVGFVSRHARPRASYRGYRAPGVDGGCDSPTALAPAEAKRILLWVCSPIKGEISPQIAVTKPGVLRKTMSSEVEG